MDDDVTKPPMEDASAIEYLCRHATEIRAQLAEAGNEGSVDEALRAVRDSRSATAALRKLHEAIQIGGDAVGLYGHLRGERHPGSQPFGLGEPRQAEAVFVCPGNRCSRQWWTDGTSAMTPPECMIFGGKLRWGGI